MKKHLIFLVLVIFFSSCQNAPKEKADLLILNATIVDVRSGKETKGQLVAISGDTILGVTPMENRNNFEAAEILDVENKFLMPGLWDMHVHFRGGDSLIEENKDLLPLFLAHGVTTVRDAGGDITPAVLEWREQIKNGNLSGPSIFTSGPKLDGPQPAWAGSIKVETPQDIEAALDSLESIGADYVKMYDGSLSKEAFYGIIKASETRGMKTTGHMPLSADILKAIEYGLDGSEHLYYTLKACSPLADSLTRQNLGYGMMNDIIETYDPNLAQEVFTKMRDHEVFIAPTLHIGKTLSEILEVDHHSDSLLPLIGDGIQETYKGRVEGAKRAKASGSTMRQKMEKISQEMIKPMFDAGVSLLAGSDCGAFNSYVYPGGSLHGEFRRFVDAGLSPRETLSTSVLKGPEFFGLENDYGSIEAGKVADIILLEKSPLENIDNLQEISVVIKNGRLYDHQELKNMLQDLERKNTEGEK